LHHTPRQTKHTHKHTEVQTRAPTVGQFPCEIAIKLMSRIRRVWQTHIHTHIHSHTGFLPSIQRKGKGGEGKRAGRAAAEQEQRAT